MLAESPLLHSVDSLCEKDVVNVLSFARISINKLKTSTSFLMCSATRQEGLPREFKLDYCQAYITA